MSPTQHRRVSKLLWRSVITGGLALYPTAIVALAQRPSGDDMERNFQAAMAAEDRGDLDQAEILLSALHRAHPGIFAVDESLGLLYARREDYSRSLPLLKAAVREQPSSDAAHANLGATYYQLHESDSARGEFERAVRINPRNVSAQESLGRLCMDDRRPDEAARALLAALRLKPNDEDLKLDCVTALLAANRTDEAQKILTTVADADQTARAQSLLGETAEKQGKFMEAGKHFDRAVQLEPSEENEWQLGYELLRHWTFEPAIAEFQAASATFPGSERLRLGLAAALFGDAQYARAVPVFADLLKNNPNSSTYAGMLGISCDELAEEKRPRCQDLVNYAQAHPNDAAASTYAAAWLLIDDGTSTARELARKLLESALVANPNLPETQFQMGVILQDSQDWQGSIPYLERAVKLKPDYAKAHYRLARAYWRTGRKRDGDEEMELQKKSSHQEQEDLNRHLRQITVFALNAHQ